MLTEIYLVRHGAALLDTGLDYEAGAGPGLSARGLDEARQAAVFLAGRGVAQVFASPLRRARQTAEEIGSHLGLRITVQGLLAEPPRDEKVEDVRARVQAFLQAAEAGPHPVIALVSHGTPLLLLRGELRQEPVDLRGSPPLPTAAIWHAQRRGPGWQISLVFTPTAPRDGGRVVL